MESLAPSLCALLAGEDDALLGDLAERLLEKPDARREAEAVGEALRRLSDFYQRDARRLRKVRMAAGLAEPFVPQHERDALFIAHGRR